MMPPNSQFLDLTQARIKHEQPCKRRVLGVNVSGFLQRSIRAKGYTGITDYGSVAGLPPSAFEMGDFRGTMYPMGLFLGKNPKNGNNIWDNGQDNGNPTNITCHSIDSFGLPDCLTDIAYGLSGNSKTGGLCNAQADPLVFIPNTTSITNIEGISVFNADKLAQDGVYFGAFSLPIAYQQTGLRWEINVSCGDYIGLTVQSGFSHMKQSYVNSIASSSTPGQTAVGPYSLSALATTGTTPTPISNLYNELNFANRAPNTSPLAAAQKIFDQYISNNIAAILNPTCFGSDPLCTFEDYSINDVNLIAHFKGVFEPFRYRHEDDDDAGSWPDMIFVPYAWIGGIIPSIQRNRLQQYFKLTFW